MRDWGKADAAEMYMNIQPVRPGSTCYSIALPVGTTTYRGTDLGREKIRSEGPQPSTQPGRRRKRAPQRLSRETAQTREPHNTIH